MTTVTCKIPAKLHARLAAAARAARASKSTIVRQSLERCLKHPAGGQAPTAFDLAKSFCGVLHGPADLSSNPRHMEEFVPHS